VPRERWGSKALLRVFVRIFSGRGLVHGDASIHGAATRVRAAKQTTTAATECTGGGESTSTPPL